MGINIEFRDDEANEKLDAVLTALDTITLNQETAMALDLEHLQTELAELRDVKAGVLAAFAAYSQELRDNASDQAAVEAIADQIDEVVTSIADAIVEGTVAGPPPDPAIGTTEPGTGSVEAPHDPIVDQPAIPVGETPAPVVDPPAVVVPAEPETPVEDPAPAEPTPDVPAEPVVEAPVDPAPVVEGEGEPVVEG